MQDDKIYISVCKNTIARNRNLTREKKVGPIRVSHGKYGKPTRCFGYGTSNAGYVSICTSEDGLMDPMPWGARAWIQITPKKEPERTTESFRKGPYDRFERDL